MFDTLESNERRAQRITVQFDRRGRVDRDDLDWLISAARAYILGVTSTRWRFERAHPRFCQNPPWLNGTTTVRPLTLPPPNSDPWGFV